MTKRERLTETEADWHGQKIVRRKGKPRGRPFQPGKPGRPPGSKNKATLVVQQRVESKAEQLTDKALEKALAGDVRTLCFLLNLLAPARKSQTLDIDIPSVKSAEDMPALIQAISAAVNDGRVTAEDVTALTALLEQFKQIFQNQELARKIEALEEEDPT
jgi:hypothetical protein